LSSSTIVNDCKNLFDLLPLTSLSLPADFCLATLGTLSLLTSLTLVNAVSLCHVASFTSLKSLCVQGFNNPSLDFLQPLQELERLELFHGGNLVDVSVVNKLPLLSSLTCHYLPKLRRLELSVTAT
jgi:hypothetical protein